METMEIWRDIPGYPGYQASNAGRIRSRRHILRPGHSRPGSRNGVRRPTTSLVVTLSLNGKTSTRRVHSLVMLAFEGPMPAGLEVRHLDGDYTNNRITNLRYGTRSENSHDALRHGTHVALIRGGH